MKVSVDAEKCIGCQLCIQVAPELFEMDEDKAIVKSQEVPEGQEDNCRQASQQCPVEAIPVEE